MDLVREKVGLNSADNCLNVHVKRMETLVSKKMRFISKSLLYKVHKILMIFVRKLCQ